MIINPSEINPLELPSMPVSSRTKFPAVSCVYFVLLDNKIQYIGKSVNLRGRWGCHHIPLRFESTADLYVAWLAIDDRESLIEIEAELIKWFNPRFNRDSIHDNTIKSSFFRGNMAGLIRRVESTQKEVYVTSHGVVVFKVIGVQGDLQSKPSIELTINDVRKDFFNFQNLLEEHGTVALTAYGKQLAKCEKL